MNFINSTTGKTENLKDTKALTFQWESMNWCEIENDVNRLQSRIAKAVANGKRNKAKRLQYLLIHSFSAKAYAVRKVTTNQGKKTSGVDKKLWSTSASKMKAVLQLTDKQYHAKPLRRIYIEKKNGKKKRPLGIPTFGDKVLQRAVTMALEAVYEQDFWDCSYGFRPGRSAHQVLFRARLSAPRRDPAGRQSGGVLARRFRKEQARHRTKQQCAFHRLGALCL